MPDAKNWPSVADFTAQMQNPRVCFEDKDLSRCKVATIRSGRPLMYSGPFATVYKVSLDGREQAVRCFTVPVTDQQSRYSELGAFLQSAQPPHFVGFEYLEDGILVGGERYPLLRMDWVEGERLDKFVGNALDDPDKIRPLLSIWRELLETLRGLGIAHNTLDHGNVLVTSEGLTLVDYDAVYLPVYKGRASPEAGHENYQHPLRARDDFDENSDRFPALVIYLSLLALSVDPGLWRFRNDANLILTSRDYQDPANSECFGALRESTDDGVRILAGYLGQYCGMPGAQVPDLETVIAAAEAGGEDAPVVEVAVSASATPAASPTSAAPPAPAPPPAASPASAAPPAPVPPPAAPPPPATPGPGSADAAPASSGANPAFGGRRSGNFRPRLSTIPDPSTSAAAPANEPAQAPAASQVTPSPAQAPAASQATPGPTRAPAVNQATPAPAQAPAASQATDAQAPAAGRVSVIVGGGLDIASADMATILQQAASALAAAADEMGGSGKGQGGKGSVPVVVVVVGQGSNAP